MFRYTKKKFTWILDGVILLAALLPMLVHLPVAYGQGTSTAGEAPTPTLSKESQACMDCHSADMDSKAAVHLQSLQKSPHGDLDCQSCHAAFTPEAPHTPAMLKSKPDCASCHSDEAAALAASVHGRADKQPGDHPTCVTCHALGKDPHAIRFVAQVSRPEKAQICSSCHGNAAKMARYGVDPAAVSSYRDSFHGKALLRFGYMNAAECVDCHGSHDVLSPANPAAPTSAQNRAQVCAKCHKGAKINFAMSGANHLTLRFKTSPVLKAEYWFFRALVFGVLVFLMLGVALDLRRRVFGPHPPAAGRGPAVCIAISFLFMAATLLMATFDIRGTMYTWLTSLGFMALAFAIYFATRPKAGGEAQKRYPRLSLTLRIQHGLMGIAFTILAITGLPQRFSESHWLGQLYVLFGGFNNARIVHRVAAVVLITVWVWHMLWLLVRWSKTGFKIRALSMLPNRKDLADFIQISKYYLHLTHEEPKYDRFQFRGKMDYFAEYWGMPVMVLSGFILWFPIYWGNRLPNVTLSFAYIAHSYEATLAFLSIVTWHMYNAHFNPEHFPMNRAWLTGDVSEEEMRLEHPLELERIESGEKPIQEAEAGGPIPPSKVPDDEFGVYINR